MQRFVALHLTVLLGAATWPSVSDASLPLAFHSRSLLQDAHAGHDHGGEPYEWAGLFATPESKYTWTSQKTMVGGKLKYVDPTMKVVMLAAATATEATLKSLEAKAKESFELSCQKVDADGTFSAAENKCYELVFDQKLDTSSFTLDAQNVKHVAIFTAHVPTEFEKDQHYLKDVAKKDIEPLFQLGGAASGDAHAGHDHGGATGGAHDGHDHGGSTGGAHDGHDHGGATGGAHDGHDHGGATGGAHDGHDHGNDAHAGHDHGGRGPYEWAGLFATPESKYTWTSQKTETMVDGKLEYVDPTMKVVMLAAATATEAALKSLEAKAKESFKLSCQKVDADGTFSAAENKCYKLVFDQKLDTSSFTLDAQNVKHVAIFTEHMPTEFEKDQHYLKDVAKKDIEPLFQLGGDAHAGHDHGGHDGHDHGGHDGHDHGGPYEWAGLFETPGDAYVWTSQRTKEEKNESNVRYADPTMKVVILPAAGVTESHLKGLEAKAKANFEHKCQGVLVGGALGPADDKCYELVFSQSLHTTPFVLATKNAAQIAIFTAHRPTEFERDRHYMQDLAGEDVEPLFELPKPPEKDKNWGAAIGAALLVNACTLIGVILLVPGISKMTKDYPVETEAILAAFAAGAILACAFFLLLFEATHLIASEWKGEVNQIWRWGTMILTGFLTAGAFEAIFVMVAQSKAPGVNGKTVNVNSVDQGPEKTEMDLKTPGPDPAAVVPAPANGESQNSAKMRVVGGVLFGDAMHNMCDGVFIGAAFHQCGSSFGWTVAGGAILHELAQELSDYAILTNPKQGAFSPTMALILNFVSGLTVLIGVIIVLAAGEYGNGWVGLILAYGGGVYVHVGAVECAPKMYNSDLTKMVRLGCLLAFIIGTVVIGLVLLDHEHCVPEGGGGAHEGHDHG